MQEASGTEANIPYITIMQTPRSHQITLEEIILGKIPLNYGIPTKTTTGTTTFFVEHINRKYLESLKRAEFNRTLTGFINCNKALFEAERSSLYHTFYIPKKTHGYRKIDEPNAHLMSALRSLKGILESFGGPLYHTAAFAYVRGRSAIDAIKKHQQNESRWFLKTDFSNFFGSINEEFLFKTISMIFPFSEYVKEEDTKQKLRQVINLCFLNGGLPQGTVTSPSLSNLVMIPIDHRIMNDVVKKGYIYTRYADDIQISSKYDFNYTKMCEYINEVLEKFEAPFKLKDEKTRYGSSAGRNWNLGVMLNKDNNITIGRKKKLQLKAACTSFIRDCANGNRWDLHDIRVLNGQISYYKMVEKDYINEFVKWFNEKHNVNLIRMIRDELK